MDFDEEDKPKRVSKPRRFAPCRAGKSKPKPEPTAENAELPSQSDAPLESVSKSEHDVDAKFAVPKVEPKLYNGSVKMETDSKVNKEPETTDAEFMEIDKIPMQEQKEEEQEEDVVVREIDVYFNPSIDDNAKLYVLQYPLRSSWRPYKMDERCEEVRVNPSTSQVEIDLSIDDHSSNYDADFGSELNMTKQTLTTTWKPPTTLDYVVGVLSGDKLFFFPYFPSFITVWSSVDDISYKIGLVVVLRLHLNPVHAVAQLRPSMQYLSSKKKQAEATDESVGTLRKQKIIEKKGVQASTDHKPIPEENWVSLEYHGLQSDLSSIYYRKGMMANGNSSVEFNMSPEDYINSLCRGESSRNSETKDSSKSQHMKKFPNDLIMEILLRLPAKSIARNRSVSKLWASILCETHFTELFLTRSLARPLLLFCVPKGGNLFFFSTPQVRNPDENSSVVAAYHHISFPFFNPYSRVRGPVCGLFCLKHIPNFKSDESEETVLVILNTSTGQSLRLPKLDRGKDIVRCLVGYDPVDKQFKALCMTKMVRDSPTFDEYQVLTLGTQNLQWRMIECSKPHNYYQGSSDEMCIDGRLYYVGYVNDSKTVRHTVIVCFDLRSEKFQVIEKGINNVGKAMILLASSTLVNYKGKLGVLLSDRNEELTARSTRLELWVLEDAEKHEWSSRISILPPLWAEVVAYDKFFFVGVTITDEIVLAPQHLRFPYFVFFYDMKTKTIRRFEIKGMEKFRGCYVRTYLNHVENLMLMQ